MNIKSILVVVFCNFFITDTFFEMVGGLSVESYMTGIRLFFGILMVFVLSFEMGLFTST